MPTRRFQPPDRGIYDAQSGEYFGEPATAGVVDLGCADGVFLPSLSARFASLIRGVVRRDVAALEQRWDNDDHLGFNHRRLERLLGTVGSVEVRKNLGFTMFDAIRIS